MRTLIAAAVSAVALLAAPAMADTAPPVETFVDVQGPGGLLKGTMLSPAGDAHAPVVLFIPGSGPTDRDGNNPLGVSGGPYRKVAEALVAEGIATVRIDKRAQFASGGASFGEAGPSIEAYAADMKAWIAEVRRRTGARCVWLAGHSEGSLVALVTAQDAEGLCGVISISGVGRRLGDVIRDQIKANPANPPEILAQTEAALTELEAGRKVDVSAMHPGLQQLFNPAAQTLFISEMRYDPAQLVAHYRGPVLVIQGTTDIQVSVADAQRLAGARSGVALQLMDGMNHVLRAAPADRAANAATYSDPSLPAFPGLAANIANFIKTHR